MSQEKTEQATPKKIQDMRKKSQVLRSQDLQAAFGLTGMIFILGFAGNYILTGIFDMVGRNLSMLGTDRGLGEALSAGALDFLRLLAPALAGAVICGVVGNILQVGFMFSMEGLRPQLSKINPLSGLKKMFSMQALVNAGKAILKFVVLGGGAYFVLAAELESLIMSSFNDAWGIFNTMKDIIVALAIRMTLIFGLVGIIDYFWQRYDFARQARMSKQDIKDEYKQVEGDPFIKSKIRERRNQISRSRMLQRVPEATVIITNPTHYAVALFYDGQQTSAPKLVAKGVDDLALKIIGIAKEHNVPLFARPGLARALFKSCEVDQEIPAAMFKLVAELIATIYARREAGR